MYHTQNKVLKKGNTNILRSFLKSFKCCTLYPIRPITIFVHYFFDQLQEGCFRDNGICALLIFFDFLKCDYPWPLFSLLLLYFFIQVYKIFLIFKNFILIINFFNLEVILNFLIIFFEVLLYQLEVFELTRIHYPRTHPNHLG